MSEVSGKIEWYLARDGQQHGPLTELELDKFIELGHLKPTDLLWQAGFDDWRPAAEVFPPLPPPPAIKPAPVARVQPAPEAAPANEAQPAPGETSQATGFGSHAASGMRDAAQPAGRETIQDKLAAHAGSANARSAPAGGQGQPVSTATGIWPDEPRLETFARPGEGRAAIQPGHNAGQAGNFTHPGPGSGYDPAAVTQRPTHHSAAGNEAFDRPQQFGPQHFGDGRQPIGPMGSGSPAAATRGALQPVSPNPAQLDDEDDYYDDEGGGRSGWLMVAAALFLLVIVGAGGLFAYNNQHQIASLYADLAGKAKPAGEIAVVRAPQRAVRELPSAAGGRPAAIARLNSDAATPAPRADEAPLPELPILKSKMWQYAQQEFGEWTEKRLAFVRQLTLQNKPKEEANKYLIDSFVRFRRDNAEVALLAPPDNLEEVARAFVASLKALVSQDAQTCYAFISNGEATSEVAPLYFVPSVAPKLEEQMLAIMKAVASGKASPTRGRQPPSAEDFNRLSAELAKRGWSPADLKLFSDPTQLAKAKPEVVCRMVTEWFATQAVLADKATRDQLIAASLRPVIGG